MLDNIVDNKCKLMKVIYFNGIVHRCILLERVKKFDANQSTFCNFFVRIKVLLINCVYDENKWYSTRVRGSRTIYTNYTILLGSFDV